MQSTGGIYARFSGMRDHITHPAPKGKLYFHDRPLPPREFRGEVAKHCTGRAGQAGNAEMRVAELARYNIPEKIIDAWISQIYDCGLGICG